MIPTLSSPIPRLDKFNLKYENNVFYYTFFSEVQCIHTDISSRTGERIFVFSMKENMQKIFNN